MPVSANVRASLYMMLSMLGFTVNDMFIKSLDGSLPSGQIMAVRGIILTVMISLIAWHQGVIRRVGELLTPMVAVGALILKEPIGWRRWIAIIIGLIGVLIIVRPGVEGFQPASLLVLASVICAAGRDLATRCLPEELPSLLVSLATSVSICVVGAAITTAQNDWQPMSHTQLGLLFCAACFLFFGYHFIVMAMRTGEIAYVVPYRYTSLIWALIGGYFVFAEVPDKYTLIGATIVVSMGLFTLYRELTAGRRAVTSTSIHARGNVWFDKTKR